MKTQLKTALKKSVTSLMALALATGCGSSASFSVMGEQNSFATTPTVVYGKIDILWVIDNSGSMASSQADLMSNMRSFTDQFWSKGIDFRMAVTTTQAYRSIFGASAATVTEFRKNSGVAIIDMNTANGDDKLIQNINQGTSGTGDERAFQSIKQALNHSINAQYGFPRADAFLAVVILSDEDDFSHDNSNDISGTAGDMSRYDNPALHPISVYTDYLFTKTNSTALKRNYTVHSITILDESCRALRNQTAPGQRIGIRYQQMADATGGETASLCGNFGDDLQRIAISSLLQVTRFQLNREPNPDTIRVWVNGNEIFSDPTNGWTYEPSTNTIVFADGVLQPGQQVTVRFDPKSIK